MPCPFIESHELHRSTISANQQMAGHCQVSQAVEARMPSAIEPVAEQAADIIPAEFAGRQADRMNNQQRDISRIRPVVIVWRAGSNDWTQPVFKYPETLIHSDREA